MASASRKMECHGGELLGLPFSLLQRRSQPGKKQWYQTQARQKPALLSGRAAKAAAWQDRKLLASNSASVAQHPRRRCGSTPLRPANAGWEGGFPLPGCVGHLTLSPQPPTTLVWRQRKTVKELGVSPLLGGNIQWPQRPWRPRWGQ